MCAFVSDPIYGAFHPPGSDSIPETTDPVVMGGLFQLCGEDSTNHTGGTCMLMLIDSTRRGPPSRSIYEDKVLGFLLLSVRSEANGIFLEYVQHNKSQCAHIYNLQPPDVLFRFQLP